MGIVITIFKAIFFVIISVWLMALGGVPEQIFSDKNLSEKEKEKYKNLWIICIFLTVVIISIVCYVI